MQTASALITTVLHHPWASKIGPNNGKSQIILSLSLSIHIHHHCWCIWNCVLELSSFVSMKKWWGEIRNTLPYLIVEQSICPTMHSEHRNKRVKNTKSNGKKIMWLKHSEWDTRIKIRKSRNQRQWAKSMEAGQSTPLLNDHMDTRTWKISKGISHTKATQRNTTQRSNTATE